MGTMPNRKVISLGGEERLLGHVVGHVERFLGHAVEVLADVVVSLD